MTVEAATGDATTSDDRRPGEPGREPGVAAPPESRIPVPPRRAVRLFDLTIDALTLDETVARIDALVAAGGIHQHVAVNVDKVVKAHRDPALAAIVNGCDVASADGQPIVWASRLLGRPLPERVTGVDLMERLIARAGAAGHRVYFLGARPEVVSGVVARVARDDPTTVVAGSRDGYWRPEDEGAVARAIAEARPDILFVAIPSPAKERFLDRWKGTIGAGFVMGVGGSFDVYAGMIPRAPERWRRFGLEWLFRLLQEPRRMWRRYLVDDLLFVPIVASAWLRTLRSRRLRSRPAGGRDAAGG
jgi:N-acetylglucosaminyldiphosphoundecaprenol N-acetyl-beta-D-mannosaminyltransferase